MELDIIYADEHLVAINKPHGLLVHRSKIARDVKEFAIQILRDQIGQRVTPVHRLDRKTSGVLLFAKSDFANKAMNKMFEANEVNKSYLAIARGYTNDKDCIDYPLKKENGNLQDSITNYETLAKVEIPFELEMHSTQRYSLVRVKPQTGRMHQIRRHFDHIRHPIIGDRAHGCNKQNRFFKSQWKITTMMLHASSLNFIHPVSGEKIELLANLQPEFEKALTVLGFNLPTTLRQEDQV